MPRKPPDTISQHVGRAIRFRRTAGGISQEDLAKRIGVTFQQVQKYERGANHCSPSRLFQLAAALSCRVLDLLPPDAGADATPDAELAAFYAVADGFKPHLDALRALDARDQRRALHIIRALRQED